MRKISLLLLLTVFVGVLMGCHKNVEGTFIKHTSELEPVTLKWYQIGTPPQDIDLVMEKVNAYTQEKINATIDLEIVAWRDYNERMQVISRSDEEYDIAFTSSWANNYASNAMRGSFVELSDLMDKYGKGIKDAIDPSFLEGAKINGKLYAVPANKEVGKQTVLVFNKDLVDKYHFDISQVHELADLEPMLKSIKENEPDITPIATFSAPLPYDSVLEEEMPFGLRIDQKDAKIVNKYNESVTLETLKVMYDYYNKGYITPDAGTSTDRWPFEEPNWFVRKEHYQPYAELTWSRSAGYDIVIQPLDEPHVVNNSVTSSMEAISAKSKNPERAMMFLNLLNTDPYLRNLLDKGIKDVHYTENAEGKIKDLPARMKRYKMPSFALGNMFVLKLYESDPNDKWKVFDQFNKSSIRSPALGFYFDSTPVITEITAISNVSNEFAPVLLKGVVDPEKYLPQFNKKLDEAGMAKVLAEMQKQYAEWLKNKK